MAWWNRKNATDDERLEHAIKAAQEIRETQAEIGKVTLAPDWIVEIEKQGGWVDLETGEIHYG